MGAKMYDLKLYEMSGVPLDKNTLKYGNAVDQNGIVVTENPLKLNLNYGSIFSIMTKQNQIETLERYFWINIPPGLTADLIERILFYRGTGCFYFNDKVGKFQFLPYALSKTIDEYGRYTQCNTFPFTGTDDGGDSKANPTEFIYQDLDIVWDLPYNREMINKARKKPVGIILFDSSLSISQSPMIRSIYVKPVIRMLSTLFQIINTAMFGAADHNIVVVENESILDSINAQIEGINKDILDGKRYTPVVSPLEITPLKSSSTYDIEGLFNTYNSLTNFLKSITGIANPGVFDKKAHLLQEEQQLNGSNADDIYYNGLRMRQEFCMLIQQYYGYPIWCQSKRGMSEAQAENVQMGETEDPDNTQYNPGGDTDASSDT